MSIRTILVSLTFIANFQVLAYDPDTGHARLLKYSIDQYNHCQTNPQRLIHSTDVEHLLTGVVAMDTGLGFDRLRYLFTSATNVFSPAKRSLNWHFYNSEQSPWSKVGSVEQSYVHLWDGLRHGLSVNPDREDKMLFIGGLAHLLEDTTVPAHVVPVYHGPTLVKHLGPKRLKPLVAYMQKYQSSMKYMIPDAIDKIPIDFSALDANLQGEAICEVLNKPPLSPEKLRWQAFKATIQLLQSPISGCSGFTWQHFWLSPKPQQYFGRYNIQDSQPLFGNSGKLLNNVGQACSLTENEQRYSNFLTRLHINAVKADVALLHWASVHFFEGSNN